MACANSEEAEGTLKLLSMNGFNGFIVRGLHAHPDRHHFVYAVGAVLVIENIDTNRQKFMHGHTNNISCLTVCKSGKYLASGQVAPMGFKAEIIIWNYELSQLYCRLELHMGSVATLIFTYADKYLISLGGLDDENLVVWNVTDKAALCGFPARNRLCGPTICLATFNKTEVAFISAGQNNLRVWDLFPEHRKIMPRNIVIGKVVRTLTCIVVDDDDRYFYCGTTTGDVLAVYIENFKYVGCGPSKNLFGSGIHTMEMNDAGHLVVGAGDGVVGFLNNDLQRIGPCTSVHGAITSIALRGSGTQFYVATSCAHIYSFTNLVNKPLEFKLISTSHTGGVQDISFPFGCSEIFATCSNHIRVWNVKSHKEVLRITVPNMSCECLAILKDGRTIVSGWSDCKIRAFYPQSGRLKYIIKNTYGSRVTAIAAFPHGTQLISGSDLGHIVIWTVPNECDTKNANYVSKHTLLKGNNGIITCIKITKDDTQCLTSCTDGSCIIWDLVNRRQVHVLRSNSLFMKICYHPEEHHVMTVGTDRNIGFWEVFDGSLLREISGSLTSSVNAIDVSVSGKYFVTGGDDKLIKLWNYDDAVATHLGIAHSAPINCVVFSPDESFIVSISADGAILRWKCPMSHGASDNIDEVD